MPLFHVIILALIQGITEFLPVSSSGHLILFHGLFENTDNVDAKHIDLLLDIAVHVGTLFAVFLYFWRDIWAMTVGASQMMIGRFDHDGAKLNVHILISSMPVIIAGLVLHMFDPLWLRHMWVVATTTILFGALLWHADVKGEAVQERHNKDMSIKDSLIIGLAQILALIPGTSRSGITMTASRYLGYSRTEAARYSLLLSTIALSGAGTLGAMDVAAVVTPDLAINILIGVLASFIAALIAIALMMRWLARQSFKVFAIYRFILGGALFAGLLLGYI